MKIIQLILLIVTVGLAGCGATRGFTAKEQNLITEADTATRMRMLHIRDSNDSVVLRTVSKDLKNIKNNKKLLRYLLHRMLMTMFAEEGIGIAAPQVGINRNIFLITKTHEGKETIQVAINPKIIAHSSELVCFERDGCLSVPDKRGNSKRYKWIDVRYYDENGHKIIERLSGHKRSQDFTGIIFQHEYDHINGNLYIDKLCE